MADIEIEQFDVYNSDDTLAGKVPVRMWAGIPPKYIVFNDIMREFDSDKKRYASERDNG